MSSNHVAMAMMMATCAISRVIAPMIPASCISPASCLAICVISCASTPVSSRVMRRRSSPELDHDDGSIANAGGKGRRDARWKEIEARNLGNTGALAQNIDYAGKSRHAVRADRSGAALSRRKNWGETLRTSIKAIAPSTVVITAAPDSPA